MKLVWHVEGMLEIAHRILIWKPNGRNHYETQNTRRKRHNTDSVRVILTCDRAANSAVETQ